MAKRKCFGTGKELERRYFKTFHIVTHKHRWNVRIRKHEAYLIYPIPYAKCPICGQEVKMGCDFTFMNEEEYWELRKQGENPVFFYSLHYVPENLFYYLNRYVHRAQT